MAFAVTTVAVRLVQFPAQNEGGVAMGVIAGHAGVDCENPTTLQRPIAKNENTFLIIKNYYWISMLLKFKVWGSL